MSKFDRVNVAALSPCCIRTIQQRPECATESEIIPCGQCGGRAQFINGTWTQKEPA